ncbi:MAG: leucine-rich repeat protein [Clostridia bacterium]|nr:leucine-rich repeat protein [Clostridia bacterium]
MTETLSSDGLAVAEKAYILDDNKAVWTLNDAPVNEGEEFEVAAGASAKLTVTLSLSDAEKKYIQTSFKNGMYVEGFLRLISSTDGQCDLTVPFMGFYGNWKKAPLLDYDCYEISDFQKDSQYTDETRPQPRVWATQMYLKYYNNDYSIPMGGFAYLQDDSDGVQQIYTEREHAAISCYNVYNGEGNTDNYMTTTEIRGLYTGLLRNCEIVTYDLYNDETGELISGNNCVYRVEKAYASGGSAHPANVEMKLNPYDMGLKSNGKYRVDYKFYFEYEDYKNGVPVDPENTVSMSFYVDYEAPILQQSRIRYFDYKENNKNKQRIYLDLDVYDNHYPQAVVLCYAKSEIGVPSLEMVTRYATPVYNAVKNGTTTVSIDITDVYEKYGDRFFVQIDDYALNHSVWQIDRIKSNVVQLPESFDINGASEITIGVNEAAKISLNYEGNANLSNFTWSSSSRRVLQVKNGEIFGVAPGTATLTVTGNNNVRKTITVNVVESNTVLNMPAMSFGTITGANNNLVKAQGAVDVNAGQKFQLELNTDPWYYVYSDAYKNLKIKWTSTDPTVATVDQNGNVVTQEKWGSASIMATVMDGEIETIYGASVRLNVQEPFKISNYTLTKYYGLGGDNGVLKVDDDKNIMYIGEDAFEDVDNVRVIILPKTVIQINEYAFRNCTSLEEVYFIDQNKIEPANSALSIIMRRAFYGCKNLKKVDLSNCKSITVCEEAFWGTSYDRNGKELDGCVNLSEIVEMTKIGTMGNRAFAGTAIKTADISGLHIAGKDVFADCKALNKVVTSKDSAIGEGMFSGCSALEEVTINAAKVGARAFKGCTKLAKVTFNSALSYSLGDEAFAGCSALATVQNANCIAKAGDKAFDGTPYHNSASAIYSNGGRTLVLAPAIIDGTFSLSGVTEIAPYAFSSSRLASGVTTINLASVEKIGEGAFARLGITSINIPSTVKEIAPHAFEGTAITSLSIPSSVTTLSNYAFADCKSLESVTFAEGIKAIGDGVFAGCTALKNVTLPQSLKEMGSLNFSDCSSLAQISLPALEALGFGTFLGCTNLASVTFDAGASTTGTATFGRIVMQADGSVVFDGCKALTSVTLGNNVKEIGAYAFAGCTSLENLVTGATSVGMYAFAGCTALTNLTGLDKIVIIEDGAFTNCSKLLDLNLSAAQFIGNGAFAGVGFTSLKLDNVISIGIEAFIDGKTAEVRLPASLAEIGDAAFARSTNLRSFTVDGGNNIFFADDGVLYRNIDGQTGAYELCAYPSAKVIGLVDGMRTYEVKEGTVSVQSYAFALLNNNTVNRVKLPYSVKVIGGGAFFQSNIIEYHFESINAPVLLTEVDYGLSSGSSYYLYYNNFYDYFLEHYAPLQGPLTGAATLKIYKPTNGIGYDNFIFKNYFSSAVELGELMEDLTRTVKNMIEGFEHTVEDINGWLNLPVNEDNKKMVTEFSEQVKEAHRLYNTIRGEVQLNHLGAETAEKLFATEAALKPVKSKFNVPFRVTSLSVSQDSTYKKEYREGERFNPKGLIVIINYDDYSTAIADMSQLTLSPTYDRELNTLDNYVEYNGYGTRVRVPITVTNGNSGNNGGEGGVNPAVIYGPIIGVVVVAAAVAATLIILKKKKAAAPAATVAQNEEETTGKSKE